LSRLRAKSLDLCLYSSSQNFIQSLTLLGLKFWEAAEAATGVIVSETEDNC
jgi:hypothetical protein